MSMTKMLSHDGTNNLVFITTADKHSDSWLKTKTRLIFFCVKSIEITPPLSLYILAISTNAAGP